MFLNPEIECCGTKTTGVDLSYTDTTEGNFVALNGAPEEPRTSLIASRRAGYQVHYVSSVLSAKSQTDACVVRPQLAPTDLIPHTLDTDRSKEIVGARTFFQLGIEELTVILYQKNCVVFSVMTDRQAGEDDQEAKTTVMYNDHRRWDEDDEAPGDAFDENNKYLLKANNVEKPIFGVDDTNEWVQSKKPDKTSFTILPFYFKMFDAAKIEFIEILFTTYLTVLVRTAKDGADYRLWLFSFARTAAVKYTMDKDAVSKLEMPRTHIFINEEERYLLVTKNSKSVDDENEVRLYLVDITGQLVLAREMCDQEGVLVDMQHARTVVHGEEVQLIEVRMVADVAVKLVCKVLRLYGLIGEWTYGSPREASTTGILNPDSGKLYFDELYKNVQIFFKLSRGFGLCYRISESASCEAGRMVEYLKTSFSETDDGGGFPANAEPAEIFGKLIINDDNGSFSGSGNSFRVVNSIIEQQDQFDKEDLSDILAEHADKHYR